MSINTEVHTEKKMLSGIWRINNPPAKPSPFSNDLVSEIEFMNPLAQAQAGIYDTTVKLPEPVKAWHPASKGAADKFKGRLGKLFPELRNLSDRELKEIEKSREKV